MTYRPLLLFPLLLASCTSLHTQSHSPIPTEVPINTTLTWPPVPNATAYDVYFGETTPTFQLRVTKPEFRLETLTANKRYLWRAQPIINNQPTTSDLRAIKTNANITTAEKYAWSIHVADSIRTLYPTPEKLGGWNYTEGMTCDALYAIALRTNREDDINHFLKNYEDATERLYSRFKDNKSVGADVEAVLDGANEIDRFMTRRLANERAERDWDAVRQDLRRLAEAYNVSWRWWT